MTPSYVLPHNRSYNYTYFFWILIAIKMEFGQLFKSPSPVLYEKHFCFGSMLKRLRTCSRTFATDLTVEVPGPLMSLGWFYLNIFRTMHESSKKKIDSKSSYSKIIAFNRRNISFRNSPWNVPECGWNVGDISKCADMRRTWNFHQWEP